MALADTALTARGRLDRPRGVRRVAELWRRFRNERDDPAPFYRLLAAELADGLERRHGPLAGARVLDLGCGPGWYTEALRAKGAAVVALDREADELTAAGSPPAGSLLGDAGHLPFPDASLDAVVCSNMLEHAPDTKAVFTELRRVLRPGGWAYMSWTNWYSPWGGHDMSPWHLLGPRWGPRLYERRHGPPRKNRYGEGLFAVHIGPTIRLVRGVDGLAIDGAEPRYWPWARLVLRVPGLRELVTWNCVLHLRRQGEGSEAGPAKVLGELDGVAGWLSDDQARRLWDRAEALAPGATVVEIGSYQGRSTAVLASRGAVGHHRGGHRSACRQRPRAPSSGREPPPKARPTTRPSWPTSAGSACSIASATSAGSATTPWVRSTARSSCSTSTAPTASDRRGDDLVRWGDRVAPGGTMLIHDAYSSVGVTLAMLVTTVTSARFRYLGRSGSMVELRREPVRGVAAGGQRGPANWRRCRGSREPGDQGADRGAAAPLTRLLGHTGGDWPY